MRTNCIHFNQSPHNQFWPYIIDGLVVAGTRHQPGYIANVLWEAPFIHGVKVIHYIYFVIITQYVIQF